MSTALTVNLASLPAEDRKSIIGQAIERYKLGESMYAIAAELGVGKTTLYRYLVQDQEEEWKNAKISRALAELEEAEEDLRTAPDALGITRARERMRGAQWHLERLMRRIYGQDAPAQLAQIVINVQNMREVGEVGRSPKIIDPNEAPTNADNNQALSSAESADLT